MPPAHHGTPIAFLQYACPSYLSFFHDPLILTLDAKQPRSLQHTFADPILRAHFIKTPVPAGAIKLIDVPEDVFLDTEQEINVIAGSLWVMSVRYDELKEEKKPKDRDELRKVSLYTIWDIQVG
jgi:hypothetical protein